MEWTGVSVGLSALSLVSTSAIAVLQYRASVVQRQLQERQTEIAASAAAVQRQLAIAHSGAQAAMAWRTQVIDLHDRGLDPEEIRYIMCCEDGGIGYEEGNGIIDEIVANIPRLPPAGLQQATKRDPRRRLPRPSGNMRAVLDQSYGFDPGI
jgi:hypothetical protein